MLLFIVCKHESRLSFKELTKVDGLHVVTPQQPKHRVAYHRPVLS